MLSSAERQYLELIRLIRTQGYSSHPTKGECLSMFAHTIIVQPEEVPLLLGRKIYWKGIVGELKAFIANENTQKGFERHGCNFWGAWANDDGSLDVDYARLLHDFNGVNQLERVVKSIKEKPDSRKHVLSLWDPSSKALQVPCVLSYQWFIEKGTLHMIWTQRSVDVMIGLASDMFSAWLFNQVMAAECGLKPGPVTMNLGDCHIYKEHLESIDMYIANASEGIPSVTYSLTGGLTDFSLDITRYQHAVPIKFELKV